ncbi:cytochrome c biogenesis protein DipZ [Aquirhabdus sp.]|uniref:cytochrome c biogenesis protein DipZ n=1 Tax=Aquirhabdus sp. TaxID=2824160 RepID=UPI00396C445C
MLIFILAYIGGALTILSPCILPVLPFVFARSGQPFVKSSLPLLTGMVLMFAVVATLAAVGGSWAVQANQYGRYAAILLLGLFGLALLFPSLSDYLSRPFNALGNRVLKSADAKPKSGTKSSPVVSSFLLGIATGLLWAPCAGPILGLVLTGAALNGANGQTTLLLLAYALGAASSLAAALLIGGKVFSAMKQSLGVGEWIRRGLGVLVLLGVTAIALGLDTGLLTKLSLTHTAKIEQALLDKVQPAPTPSRANPAMVATPVNANTADQLPIEGTLPSLSGAVQWLNSPPLTAEGLRGKVVLVDFWTYSCINCLRTLPYVNAWAQKYKDQGLVVIGVHAPEFAFEKDIGNVTKAVHDLKISYPVAIDNNYAIWRAFNNQYWPAHYFIDAKGQVRYHHFGEGEYEQSEKVIQQLLAEAGHHTVATGFVEAKATGVSMAADDNDVQSPETYVGYARAEHFASKGGLAQDQAHLYTLPQALDLNQWGLQGNWKVEGEKATALDPHTRLRFRFHARDLHLVMGPNADGKPVSFKVSLDGQAPKANHGIDIDEHGLGTVTGQRLYQLIRQSDTVQDHTFEIEFLDPKAEVFSFTFG